MIKSTWLKKFLTVTVVAVLIAVVPVLTWAQATTGAIVGTVLDASGAAVPNADVTATNTGTGVQHTVKTNAKGEYRLENLIPGIYSLSGKASGFAAATASRVAVELNKTITVPLSLQVGAASTTVEVSGAAPAIDTTTAQVSTTYDAKQTSELPTANIGSGVLNLSLLQAGVGSSGGIGAGSGPSVGGQRARNNNFTVEGVDINDKSVTGPIISLPGDSVANFTVIQNQFTPEFGHSSGGQFNQVIQSGTNSFHGKAYEYLQNRNLNAIDALTANSKCSTRTAACLPLIKNPRYDNNRFGGSIGGPIIKNKLFFFFNGEYQPIGQSAVPTAVSAPTAAGYTTLSGIAGLSATNLSILKKYVPAAPTADLAPITVAGVPIAVGTLPLASPNFRNQKKYLGSADWTISDHDTLRGRYVYNSSVGIDTAATLPVFFAPSPSTAHLFTMSEFHVFSPSITNEFRIGFSRSASVTPSGAFTFPGLDQFPNLSFQDLGGLQVGPDPNAPQFGIQNLYQLTDNVSWNRGNHNFKFGIEAHHYISPQSFTQRSRGDYNYNTLDFYLRDQAPEQLAERSGGNTTYYGDQNAIYWFVNDTWKIRPSLTLNLGLRHEYTTRPMGERRQNLNKISDAPSIVIGGTPLTFDSPQAPKTNFAPRVGIAWAPSSSGWMRHLFGETPGDTSVRAGFGMAYDVLYDNIGILEQPPQIGSTTDCAQSDYPNSSCPPIGAFLANGGIKGGGNGITNLTQAYCAANGITVASDQLCARFLTASWIPPRVRYPYSMSWNFGIERIIHKDYTFEIRYVGTRGVNLDTQIRANKQVKVTPTQFLPTYLTAPSQATLDGLPTTLTQLNAKSSFRPDFAAAGFNGSSLVAFLPEASSTYHGLALQLTRRFSNGLYLQGAYTWSHNIDNATADFFSTFVTPRRAQDFQDLRSERSNSGLDRNQRFTLAMVYDAPWFSHSSNWLMKNIVGNWEAAPVYTFETGEWADVQSARDVNLNGDSAGDRVILNPAGNRNTGSDVTALKNTAGATVAYLAKDPTAYYIRGGSGALATSSRNTLQLPGINNVDMTLLKRFSFTERFKFEFSAQMLNALNHPQFIPGSLNDIASVGQAGAPTLNMLTPGNSHFNRPDLTFASNARVIQLVAKFVF